MKRTLTFLTLCAIATTAHAQQSTEPVRARTFFQTQVPAQSPRTRPLPQGRVMPMQATGNGMLMPRPEWLDKVISLNFKNEKPADAAKIILKAAGRALETVEIDKDLPSPQISLTIKNVQVGDALAAIGRLANATALVSEKDDKVTVHLRKRTTMLTTQVYTNTSKVPADVRREVDQALSISRNAIASISPNPGFQGALGISAWLPNKKVSLDVRNTDAREILKNLLKQADVSYILEDDVPENKKFSFTFENVPLRTALDMVCQSLEVGWGAQKSINEKDSKVTVRIGKKWARHNTMGSVNFYGNENFNNHFAFPSFPDAYTNSFDFTVPSQAPITVNGIVREIEVLETER